ncbi:helicase-exonuclease AddAB subunit AddB [Jeotgalibacillus proteolyticus]|uniref:ATP-dependent helicase/deoxyribonuclease subunit B n=1 Tax=Jeotgalibacillus proteolyticus TaxID=2082395 RepID=A0A2S5GHJ5_9BACL|nr:helicase-exonuclease AddAB subunit AddB [Jeotgalibacillus proteolyticus]PPA72375.1 helicase-exonuclease AddAB subunit AddB [Jeotgalibacillus proteolyticus]
MSVTIKVGRSGSGKTSAMMEDVLQKLKKEPDGKPIVLLVPEQMTFQSEYSLASQAGGMIRAQVFSFTRLAWRVLQETGGSARQHVNQTGITMLIRKIINEQKEQLKLFGRAATKHGFIQHVESMITEFRRYCIQPEDLTQQAADLSSMNAPKSLVDKLSDLETIYRDFDQLLAGKYIDAEDYFKLLAANIAGSSWVKEADIYIDGFHSFTPQEYLVLSELMTNGKNVTVALTMDEPGTSAALFRQTNETFLKIKEIAQQKNIKVKVDHEHGRNRFESESLTFLESSFEQRNMSYNKESSLYITEAANRRAEVEGIAREIRKLARSEGFRYKDMAMLMRNGHAYHELIEPIFYDYEIPYFIDEKRTMLNHPLVEFIRSTLEMIVKNWRYDSVFRAVKTELFYPDVTRVYKIRRQMDRLENYTLAHGIQGDRWIKQEYFHYRRFRGLDFVDAPQTDHEQEIESDLNEARSIIVEPMKKFHRRLNRNKTARGKSQALYQFLEELSVPEKLEQFAVMAEERGDLLRAREHDQAWNAVIDLLDQLVEMLGDENMTTAEFADLLETGLEALEFSLVPPSVDHVIIADLDKSRLPSIKAAFVLGVNDGVLPSRMQDDGVLAEEDRDWLERSGLNLAPNAKTRLLDEEFMAYRAFTSSSQRLYVSYPIADEEGKSLLASPYINRLKEVIPSFKGSFTLNDPIELAADKQLEYICHPEATISYLTTQLQQLKRNYPMADHWWDVYNFYAGDLLWKDSSRRILSSLFYRNTTKPLSADTTKELYGSSILASVSRMEKLNSCAFSHFASHGLKLQERSVFKLEAPNIGELFHAALKWISEQLIVRKLDWKKVTRELCQTLAKEAVEHLAPRLQHQILLSSSRYQHIAKKLEGVIGQASYIISEHARSSGFVPIGVEVGFGPRQELPPLEFELTNGATMQLQGRIDRVDTASIDEKVYLRVIDYKSSARDLDFTEIYYGLSLQMLTYLDIALSNSKQLVKAEADPAGILYFHLHNPLIKSKKRLSLDEIEEELLKQYKMKGLVLGDEEAVRLMDQTLEQGQSSIISAGLKKDGSLRSDSKSASKGQFQAMRQHTRKLFQQSGDRIMSGDVNIDPYEFKKRTPCQFCSYRSVCQFDQALEDNQYRKLQPKKPEDLLLSMREEEWQLDTGKTK